MAIDYSITAKEIVKELGGDENIVNVTHCATRLRFILKDESVVDGAKVAKIPGVITTVQAGGQYQIVIGNHVSDAYAFVMKLVHVESGEIQDTGKKAGVVSRIIDVISSIFAPFLYTLAACGILQGILGVLLFIRQKMSDIVCCFVHFYIVSADCMDRIALDEIGENRRTGDLIRT